MRSSTLGDEVDKKKLPSVREKREMNSLVPINRLPPEILGQIFEAWVMLWRKMQAENGEWRASDPMWTLILLVCRYWYNTAVSTHMLWNTFAVNEATRVSVAEALLCRSARTPLYITILGAEMEHKAMQLVLEHLYRIRSLLLYTNKWHDNVTYVLGGSAPLLRSIHYVDESSFLATQSPKHAGVPFRSVNMPALTSLEYWHPSYIPWDLPLFKPTLTHLSLKLLYGGRPTTYFAVGMDDVLRALTHMPLLQHLELHNVLPPRVSGPSPKSLDVVPLPHLRMLDLLTGASSAARLIRHLAYPPSVHIHLCCSDSLQGRSADLLYLVLTAKMPRLGTHAPLSTVCIDESGVRAWSADPGVDVLASHALTLGTTAASSQFPAPLALTLHGWTYLGAWSDVHDVVRSCVDAGVLQADRVAALYYRPSMRTSGSQRHWAAVCARMSRVRTLGIGHGENEWAESVVEAFGCLHPGTAEEGQPRVVPLPALEVLLLRKVRLARSSMAEQNSEGEVFHALCQMLEARKAAGYPLQRLVLVECIDVCATDVDALSSIAGKVEWDGRVHSTINGE